MSTAGEAMQRTYEKEHGIQSVILRHGFDAPAAAQSRRGGDGIVIGFVGSAYGRDAWTAFLSAAARLNASGKLPQIKMRTFGAGVLPYRREGVEIESKGWRPAAEMLRGIAETDFCYLPYWFESKKRRHVELSFPNKFERDVPAPPARRCFSTDRSTGRCGNDPKVRRRPLRPQPERGSDRRGAGGADWRRSTARVVQPGGGRRLPIGIQRRG